MGKCRKKSAAPRFCASKKSCVSIGSVHEANETVFGPTFIIRLGAHRIQLSPPCRYLDAALGNAATHQSLFDPLGTPLREVEIVEPVAARGCVSVDIEAHIRMIFQPLRIAVESTQVR